MAKVGVLGFAHGHIFAFGGIWKDTPEHDVSFVKGFDHNEERGKEGCAKLGCEFSASLQDVLDDKDIDSVVVTAETSYHADYIAAAAKAGKNIICYKPLALNMEQADRIVKAVEESGVRFTMAWQMRTDSQNIKVKELLDSGEFGKIYSFRRRHGLATQKFEGFDSSWHVDPKLNRDIFADDAAHAVDFLYWVMGMPDSVSATLATMENQKVPNDNGIAIYQYADGSLAEISCNFVCLAAINSLEIQCEKGTIILDFGDVPSTMVPHGTDGLRWIKDGDENWTVSEIPSPGAQWERIAWQAGPLALFLNGKGPPIASVKEARDVLRMVLACYVSNETGRRVPLTDESVTKII